MGLGDLDRVVVFIDESQDAQNFVLAGVGAPDILTLQDIVGDMRSAARRWNIPVPEFHESALYRANPRLLTRSLELLAVVPRRRGRRPAPRENVRAFVAYYQKTPAEQQNHALPMHRLLSVYRAAFEAIMWAIPPDVDEVVTVCDEFKKDRTLEAALQTIHDRRFSGAFRFGNSEQDKPLQLADLVAGTVRRSLTGDANEGRFGIIAPILFHRGFHCGPGIKTGNDHL